MKNQITLKQFLECIGYRITEGSDFQWRCYGPNTYQLESCKMGTGGHVISVVFDKSNQTVYEMQAWVDDTQRQYRWIHPDHIQAVRAECEMRSLRFTESIDGQSFIDLDLAVDILEKSTAIANGLPYDERVQVELDLVDGDLANLMMMAHERDITLNKMVEEILRRAVAGELND